MERKISAPVLLISLTGLFASTAAMAGYQTGQQVVMVDALHLVIGELGHVRHTPDSIQYIECQDDGGYAMCAAVDSRGVSMYCITSDPAIIATIRSIKGDSYLTLQWLPQDNRCTYLEVENSSTTDPK